MRWLVLRRLTCLLDIVFNLFLIYFDNCRVPFCFYFSFLHFHSPQFDALPSHFFHPPQSDALPGLFFILHNSMDCLFPPQLDALPSSPQFDALPIAPQLDALPSSPQFDALPISSSIRCTA